MTRPSYSEMIKFLQTFSRKEECKKYSVFYKNYESKIIEVEFDTNNNLWGTLLQASFILKKRSARILEYYYDVAIDSHDEYIGKSFHRIETEFYNEIAMLYDSELVSKEMKNLMRILVDLVTSEFFYSKEGQKLMIQKVFMELPSFDEMMQFMRTVSKENDTEVFFINYDGSENECICDTCNIRSFGFKGNVWRALLQFEEHSRNTFKKNVDFLKLFYNNAKKFYNKCIHDEGDYNWTFINVVINFPDIVNIAKKCERNMMYLLTFLLHELSEGEYKSNPVLVRYCIS